MEIEKNASTSHFLKSRPVSAAEEAALGPAPGSNRRQQAASGRSSASANRNRISE